jgi:hypothetical protein
VFCRVSWVSESKGRPKYQRTIRKTKYEPSVKITILSAYLPIMKHIAHNKALTKLVLTLLFALSGSFASAQVVGIGLGTGLNSYHGILGANLEVGGEKAAVRFGAGLGTWGYKLGGGVIIRKQPAGWGFGIGLLRSTGLKDFKSTMETTSGTSEVTLDLLAVSTLNLTAIKGVKVGNGDNLLYLEFGYSAYLGGATFYRVKDGSTLNDTGRQVMQALKPGGLVLGIAFRFKVQ